ncbi:MAG: hypothetical protein JXQ87_06355 [Bacteroidia bacterium]
MNPKPGNIETRRAFIKQMAAIAPIVLLGLNSCKGKPDLNALKSIDFPKLKLPNSRAFTVDSLLSEIEYTGKEGKSELVQRVMKQMERDFAQGNAVFANGWWVSRTEVVLANLIV